MVRETDALVDGKAGDLAVLMVAVSPYGADTIRTESHCIRAFPVYLFKFLYTVHFNGFLSDLYQSMKAVMPS